MNDTDIIDLYNNNRDVPIIHTGINIDTLWDMDTTLTLKDLVKLILLVQEGTIA